MLIRSTVCIGKEKLDIFKAQDNILNKLYDKYCGLKNC